MTQSRTSRREPPCASSGSWQPLQVSVRTTSRTAGDGRAGRHEVEDRVGDVRRRRGWSCRRRSRPGARRRDRSSRGSVVAKAYSEEAAAEIRRACPPPGSRPPPASPLTLVSGLVCDGRDVVAVLAAVGLAAPRSRSGAGRRRPAAGAPCASVRKNRTTGRSSAAIGRVDDRDVQLVGARPRRLRRRSALSRPRHRRRTRRRLRPRARGRLGNERMSELSVLPSTCSPLGVRLRVAYRLRRVRVKKNALANLRRLGTCWSGELTCRRRAAVRQPPLPSWAARRDSPSPRRPARRADSRDRAHLRSFPSSLSDLTIFSFAK